VPLTRVGIWSIITTFRKALTPEEAMKDSQVEKSFKRVWPDLEKAFSSLPNEDKPPPPDRSNEEMTAEILELVRGLSRSEPIPTVATWDTGMTGVAMQIANDLGLDVRSVSHTGVHRGVYSIGLLTSTGKEYSVRVPVETPTSAFRTVVRTALLNQGISGSKAQGRREMVPDENDFLNSKA